MVVNGSLSKTAVNGGAGAQSQISGLVVAVLTVVTLLFLTGLFESLPEATLAAVVIAAVIELVDIPALVRLYRIWTRRLGKIYGPAARPDFLAARRRAARRARLRHAPRPVHRHRRVADPPALPRVAAEHRGARARRRSGRWVDSRASTTPLPEPGVAVLRVEAGLFFANADHVRDAIRAHAREPTA